jgi:ABC-type arginine transport system permease subunit
MTLLTEHLLPVFLPQLLAGMAVNFKIAAIALLLGLALGLPLTLARLSGSITGAAASTLIGLLRAAPTFVVMFFLFNVIAKDAKVFGYAIALSGVMTVAVSLVPYAAAYVADNGAEALQQLRRGAPLAALLFLPNVGRAFFVLVMSSSAGAAIGVNEGIAVILREAERLPATSDKFLLFAVGIACFGVALQVGFAMINLLKNWLGTLLARKDTASSQS